MGQKEDCETEVRSSLCDEELIGIALDNSSGSTDLLTSGMKHWDWCTP
jgi:hypothetical protein